MNVLVDDTGRTTNDAVTLSLSVDRTREAAVRDHDTLERARNLLADAYTAGAGTPRAETLVAKATALLAKGGSMMEQREVGAVLGFDGTTISKYRTRSKPGGSMASHPFPAADHETARSAVWLVARVPDLFEWISNRPGRGAGGGRPWHADERPNPKLLLKLPTDWWTLADVMNYLEGTGQKVSRGRLLRLISDEEMPKADREFEGTKAWLPDTVREWRPAKEAAKR